MISPFSEKTVLSWDNITGYLSIFDNLFSGVEAGGTTAVDSCQKRHSSSTPKEPPGNSATGLDDDDKEEEKEEDTEHPGGHRALSKSERAQ